MIPHPSRNSRRLGLLAVAAIAPFVVGFAPADRDTLGIHAAAGHGRFVSARSSCSPPQISEYSDYQGGFGYESRALGDWNTRVGGGLDVNAMESTTRTCNHSECRGDPPAVRNPLQFDVAPYAQVDWRYLGLRAGLTIPTWTQGTHGRDILEDWRLPGARAFLRIGPEDLFYGSAEMADGSPRLSGGSPLMLGIGGRALGWDLWTGYSINEEWKARIGREFGPLRARVTAGVPGSKATYHNDSDGGEYVTVRVPGYDIGAALEYRFGL